MKIDDFIVKVNKEGKDSKYSLVDFLRRKTKLDLITKPNDQKQTPIKLEILNKNDETKILETIPDALEFTDFEISNLNNIKDEELRDLIKDLKLETITGDNENTEKLNFAKMDYNLVQGEIIDIKGCRTNIFMGTLGVIGAVAAAIVAIVGSETSTNWPTWLPLASMVPIALLTSALLSTAHKARGLNLRVSFLEVMGEYLSMGEVPIGYRGWHKTKQLLERCQIYLNTKNSKNKNCKYFDENEAEKSKRIQPGCIKIAKETASEINKGLPTFPPFLHNFNSLSAYIFTIAYFIASMAVVIGFIPTMQKYMVFDSKQNYILISIIVSILSVFLGLLSFHRKKKEEQEISDNYIRDKKNILELFIKYYGCLAAFLLPTFIITLLFSNKTEYSIAIFTISNGIGALISIILFAIWYFSYDKILSLRRGRYSTERWKHIWRICLTECPLMQS